MANFLFLCETRDAWRCGAEMAFFYGVGFRVLRGHITFFFFGLREGELIEGGLAVVVVFRGFAFFVGM